MEITSSAEEDEPAVEACLDMTEEEMHLLTHDELVRTLLVMQVALRKSEDAFKHVSSVIAPPRVKPTATPRPKHKMKRMHCMGMEECVAVLAEAQEEKLLQANKSADFQQKKAARSAEAAGERAAKKARLDGELPVVELLIQLGYLVAEEKLTVDPMRKLVQRNAQHFVVAPPSAKRADLLAAILTAIAAPPVVPALAWTAAAPIPALAAVAGAAAQM